MDSNQQPDMRPRGNQASRRVIHELRMRVEALEKKVQDLEKAEKPKRGRPPKSESEE